MVKAIKERTTRGRDLNDAAFQPYSTRSAGARKYVRERKGGRTSPVTLQDEGVMMSQLEARAAGKQRTKVRVASGGSPNRAKVAEGHQRGSGVLPARPWLGMSPNDMKGLNSATLFFLEKLLNLKGPGLSLLRKEGSLFQGKAPWRLRGNL